MEILGFFTAIFVGIWAVPFLTIGVILVGLAFTLAYEKEGWGTGALAIIVAGTVWAFWGQVSWGVVALWVSSYIAIGILMTYPLYNSYSRRKARDWLEALGRYNKGLNQRSGQSKQDFLTQWYKNNGPEVVGLTPAIIAISHFGRVGRSRQRRTEGQSGTGVEGSQQEPVAEFLEQLQPHPAGGRERQGRRPLGRHPHQEVPGRSDGPVDVLLALVRPGDGAA
jgi:hypothetical protein